MTTLARDYSRHRDASRSGDDAIEILVPVRRGPAMMTLWTIGAVLFLCSAAGQIGRFHFDQPTMLGFVPLFDVNAERSFSTWYQSVALLACAGLLAAIASVDRARRTGLARRWAALAIIFLALSADEVAGVHERTGELLKRVIAGQGGILEPGWVLLGIPFAAGVVLVYARFLLRLPRRERGRFLLAGGIYLGGAIGVEMAAAGFADGTAGLAVAVHMEELLEMAGILIFLDALLRRLARSAAVIDRI